MKKATCKGRQRPKLAKFKYIIEKGTLFQRLSITGTSPVQAISLSFFDFGNFQPLCGYWYFCCTRGKIGFQIEPFATQNEISSRNWPFPSYLVPLCQTESSCKTIHMKMCFVHRFIVMPIKVIFILKERIGKSSIEALHYCKMILKSFRKSKLSPIYGIIRVMMMP